MSRVAPAMQLVLSDRSVTTVLKQYGWRRKTPDSRAGDDCVMVPGWGGVRKTRWAPTPEGQSDKKCRLSRLMNRKLSYVLWIEGRTPRGAKLSGRSIFLASRVVRNDEGVRSNEDRHPTLERKIGYVHRGRRGLKCPANHSHGTAASELFRA